MIIKKSMFNNFYNFSFDDDMLSEWTKKLESVRLTSKSLPLLHMTVQFILDKFLQPVLNLKSKILLKTLEDEADDNTP